MCGIAVLIGADAPREALHRMAEVASRRGPERTRIWAESDCQLAHAALSFVEIGDNSQPHVRADGSWIVWNGEIYNWRELSAAYDFSATTDTGTLLSGLRARG